jgi:hypothetical protein
MKNKKKQGDPRKTPRSPWGLPPREKENPPERNKYQEQKEDKKTLEENRQEAHRQMMEFLFRPMPEGMLSHLVMLRQRPFPGSLEYANTGQNFTRRSRTKLPDEKPTITKSLTTRQVLERWRTNTTGL